MDDKHCRARITQRTDFAPDLWMIRVDPQSEFSFTAGQYATLGVERDARRRERPYSIASSPHEKELEFFFELVPDGETTPPLHDLQLGDEVLMRKVAKGRFTLDFSQPDRTSHLLVSTVTGVAPFVSYVRTLFKDWKEGRFAGNHKLFLLNGASRSWEFGYREELENISRQAPWFRCIFTVSRPWEDENWKGEVGRVDDLLRKYADQWGCTAANSIAYLCGHPQMVEQAKGILKRIGLKNENVKEEVYWVPAKASGD
jgi:ferredoxin--NADP+ reductase